MGRSYKGGVKMNRKYMMEQLMDYFRNNQDSSLSVKNLYEELRLKTHPMRSICLELVLDLVDVGFLKEENGRFCLAQKDKFMEGVLQRRVGGKNYFIPDDGSCNVFIAERNAMGATNGDRVKIVQYAKAPLSGPEGEVVEILKRAKETFVGTLQKNNDCAFVVTPDRSDKDILVPYNAVKKLHNGDKVIVKVVEWPTETDRSPIGKIVEVLGASGENETEMHAILAEYGLPYSYPEQLEQAANAIPAEIPEYALLEREDFRDVVTFTIDPRDAKDFDDALSIREIGKGLWEVGVHIADVSHYVEEGSPIDKEAFKRATSIYLVDRTIPMLPENLCNNLCSLRPNEDKLAYSVIFEMTDAAVVKKYRIVRTVIRSNRRYTYEEAQAIIERFQQGGNEPLPGDEYTSQILQLDRMAKILREKRFVDGALGFDRVEVRFDIDEKGHPMSVYFKESKDANQLIEEFMLLANRSVAEYIGKKQDRNPKTFVYRVHDVPDPDRLSNLQQFIAKFGYKIKITGTNVDVAKSMNKLLADVKGKKEQNLVEIVSIRSMQKAIYTTDNIGHYGLAFDYYTHFTSPIRRYPDLMVHRLLTRYLSGGRSVMKAKCEENCEHCSHMEQLAEQAERASIKYKQVEYMADRMGQVYDAVISGVTEWGIYAEIVENKCEGMIPIRSLEGDYFEFDEKNYRIVGRKTKRTYRLGDPVRIQVAKCNLERKQMDYELVE